MKKITHSRKRTPDQAFDVRLKIAMKALPVISAITLIVSLGAGFVAIRAKSEVSEAKLSALVDARLAARELKLVQAWAPKYLAMIMEMDESEYGTYNAQPPEPLKSIQ